MSSSRALATLAVAYLATVAAAGCGGDSAGDTTNASQEALAKVRASDYGRAVNLHATDFPYFEEITEDKDEDPRKERRQEHQLKRCLGTDDDFGDSLAEVNSATFGTDSPEGFIRVQSSVGVGASATEARRAVRLVHEDRTLTCLRRVLVSAIEEEDSPTAEIRRATLTRIPFPATEIDDAFSFRFTAKVDVQGSTSELTAYAPAADPAPPRIVDVYVDLLGFVVGPAGISLTTTGAPSPVSRTLEGNLLRLLHERATERHP